jgi:hypothetical protein
MAFWDWVGELLLFERLLVQAHQCGSCFGREEGTGDAGCQRGPSRCSCRSTRRSMGRAGSGGAEQRGWPGSRWPAQTA